ncbi:hypothetical protein KAU30_01425 [Candidatus Bathyarchaeota archaeon]|nr:hypothetical protein [Candidatus Bathyarchaeota archaeon]
MPRSKSQKKRKHKSVGIEAVVKPGVGALYVRGLWRKKLIPLKLEKSPAHACMLFRKRK